MFISLFCFCFFIAKLAYYFRFIFKFKFLLKRSESEVAQSGLTLCNPMNCSLRGSSIHGIFQARLLELVAIAFSRWSSWHRDRTRVSHIVGRHFTFWASFFSFIFNWLVSFLLSFALQVKLFHFIYLFIYLFILDCVDFINVCINSSLFLLVFVWFCICHLSGVGILFFVLVYLF